MIWEEYIAKYNNQATGTSKDWKMKNIICTIALAIGTVLILIAISILH